MKTKQEIKQWLLENCVDKNGDLILIDLDFSDFDGNIFLSYMKVKCDLYQANQEVKGDIYQAYQKANGDLIQNGNIVGGNLFQGWNEVKGNIYQGADNHKLKGEKNENCD